MAKGANPNVDATMTRLQRREYLRAARWYLLEGSITRAVTPLLGLLRAGAGCVFALSTKTKRS